MKISCEDRLRNYLISYSHERVCAKLVATEEELINANDEITYLNNKLNLVEKDNENLKQIEKEHQKLNGELRKEIERLETILAGNSND